MSCQPTQTPAAQIRPGQHAHIYGTWRKVREVKHQHDPKRGPHVVILDNAGGVIRTPADFPILTTDTPPPGPRARLDALGRITELERRRRQLLDNLAELEAEQAEQITRARQAGALWASVARALGCAISTAQHRHRKTTTTTTTTEQGEHA